MYQLLLWANILCVWTSRTATSPPKPSWQRAQTIPINMLRWVPQAGSSTLALVAVALASEVFAQHCDARLANGVYWYNCDKQSFGFAASSRISLNSADTSSEQCERRLSWHLDQTSGGYRVGCTTNLNSDSSYYKQILILSGESSYLAELARSAFYRPIHNMKTLLLPFSPLPWLTHLSQSHSIRFLNHSPCLKKSLLFFNPHLSSCRSFICRVHCM
jgi:hypothetical protein